VGDTFLLHVLEETLTYQVDQISIVLPYELENLAIEEGKDYCTLVTCTPYGINSHRLLVRGRRIAIEPEKVAPRVTADAIRTDPLIVASALAVPMLILVMLFVAFYNPKKR
jgi:sortase A